MKRKKKGRRSGSRLKGEWNNENGRNKMNEFGPADNLSDEQPKLVENMERTTDSGRTSETDELNKNKEWQSSAGVATTSGRWVTLDECRPRSRPFEIHNRSAISLKSWLNGCRRRCQSIRRPNKLKWTSRFRSFKRTRSINRVVPLLVGRPAYSMMVHSSDRSKWQGRDRQLKWFVEASKKCKQSETFSMNRICILSVCSAIRLVRWRTATSEFVNVCSATLSKNLANLDL